MKKLNLLIALSIGIISSASGMIQVGAATYNYFVDFSTKEVANFNDYKQSFSSDTYNLDATIKFNWSGSYRFDSCPTAFTANFIWQGRFRINGTGGYSGLASANLPDFPCTTTNTTFLAEATATLPASIVDTIMDDDANFVEFLSRIIVPAGADTTILTGRTLYLVGYNVYFDLTYDFNTTYLFNYFLSDQNYAQRSFGGVNTTLNATQSNYLVYLYTTAGNDEYYIYNLDITSIGTNRKKYAVDYNEEFFRGESIGAGFRSTFTGTDQFTFNGSSISFNWNYNYYFLNAANAAQAIVDAPQFNFDYDDCGSFLALNVGCFINNGLAYITNDAPIISDAITLLNAGVELAAQTFGIIGNFADDNIFGFLILVGFGFIAVKWLLKND